MINLFINGEYEKPSDIPQILIDNIRNQLDNPNNGISFNALKLTYIDDNTYRIICVVLDQVTENFYEAETLIDINIVRKIMVKFIFDMNTGYYSIDLTDDNNRPFIFEDKFKVGDYGGEGALLFYIRRGIWETLNYT